MALGLGVAATSCDTVYELPPMVTPVATIEANTTISELKADFYNDGSNYATQVGTKKTAATTSSKVM